MRAPWTAEFTRQAEAHRLCYTCPDCGHFDAEEDVCCHGWPLEDHRRKPAPGAEAEVVFCKEFELK